MATEIETDAVDPTLVDTVNNLFSRTGPTERDPVTGVAFDRTLWNKLDELGLARLTAPEDQGGSGAGWRESAAVVGAAASHAVSLPLVEHDLLAGWLLAQAGLPGDAHVRTACVLHAGHATAVPWARHAERIVVLWQAHTWLVADVPASEMSIVEGSNLAGEPRDDVRVDMAGLSGVPVPDNVANELVVRGALARAVQMCQALERIVDLCVEHATTRVQFGRPLAKFQALQQQLADAAAESALARAAVNAAVRRMDTDAADLSAINFAVATARSCVGHAASLVVRHAHQIHGAIGTTLEHPLHRFTLPALSWRAEYGSVQHWDDVVADAALAAGGHGLWQRITR
ncbi:acyl-CoA dehydrogenase family protein [Streptomyces sp. NPDC058232]|uniref:acyl-CoA dehydrogenase family protein n=1 Tax=Streptomyces sp. NPDC058232 TaxID=3346393 RepID=UPI0036E57008